MTSRERIIAAINHREPDRVPVDIGAFTNIHVDLYYNICRNLNLDFLPPKVYDLFSMHAVPELSILQWFGSDCIGLPNPVDMFGNERGDMRIWKNHRGNDCLIPSSVYLYRDERNYSVITDQNGHILLEMPPDGEYFDRVLPTGMSANIEFTDLPKFRKTLPVMSDDMLKILQDRAKFLYENTELSIFGCFADKALFSPGLLANHTFTEWMCLMLIEPEYCKDVLGIYVDWYKEKLTGYLQAVGKYIDVILLSTADFGSQKAEFFSPEVFKELYVGPYSEMNGFVHKHSKVKTFFHSCGSIKKLFPYLIEAGVDIINPIQTAAAGMDPAELKKKYGDKIVFWGGGIDTQKTLPHGTPEDVRLEVKQRMKDLAPGGGFVFSPEHCLQSDIPFENLSAMVEAVREYRLC